jgi:hypothetical protein
MWAAGILVMVAALAGALPSCSNARPCTCRQLQERAARCERQTLELVRQRMGAGRPDAAIDVSEQQYKMFEYRFQKKIKNDAAFKQCERYRGSDAKTDKERLARMTGCCTKEGCDAFAACIVDF